MYYYLQKAQNVYTTHISESCAYAVVLGKYTQPIDVWNNIQRGSFYCINNHLFYHQLHGKKYINKTFSNPKFSAILTVIKFLEYSIPFLNVVGP